MQHYPGTPLAECLSRITPVSAALADEAMAHINTLTKPLGSLGRLEELAARLYAVRNGVPPLAADPARVITIAGDHGVIEEGVSSSPAVVTRQQVYNFLNGGGGISVMCRCNGIGHQVVDAGVAGEEFPDHPLLVRRKIAPGTANIAKGPAMTVERCLAALELGMDLAAMAHADGVQCLGTGEMGIGNTTPSTALFAALYGLDPADITGPGAGVPPTGLAGKVAVIRKALDVNANAVRSMDPVAVLAALGGLEIAALTGLILGAAARRIPVMVDGFISTAACAAALAMAPAAGDYCFFGHASAEPGHALILERMGQRPLVDLGLRLGEGTGAVFGIVLLRSAAAMFNDMATFSGAGVTAGI